jgi:hypothetical protein
LGKQGYKIVGTHSGVKLCRWTKSMLRGRGGCYKHTFYGTSAAELPSSCCMLRGSGLTLHGHPANGRHRQPPLHGNHTFAGVRQQMRLLLAVGMRCQGFFWGLGFGAWASPVTFFVLRLASLAAAATTPIQWAQSGDGKWTSPKPLSTGPCRITTT